MNSTEAASKNGRSFTKNADVPAAPAAKRNGSSGKQQLEARITLPSAATLAAMVRFERGLFSPASPVFVNTLLIQFFTRVIALSYFDVGHNRTACSFPMLPKFALAFVEMSHQGAPKLLHRFHSPVKFFQLGM